MLKYLDVIKNKNKQKYLNNNKKAIQIYNSYPLSKLKVVNLLGLFS